MSVHRVYVQTAPYPGLLASLVERSRYRPGWKVWLENTDRDKDGAGNVIGAGLTLVVRTCGYDSYHPDRGENYRVLHYFPVPPATYDERSWRRWLFEQLLLVERHEAMEFFAIQEAGPGGPVLSRPYAPSHGPGNDPYIVREVGTELDQRTRFTGEVVP